MQEHDDLTEKIIGAAIEVHRIPGPGLLESIYEEALAVELGLRGNACQRQVAVDVVYKDTVIKGQRLDLLVAGEVIVETKSAAKLPDADLAQVLWYLKATRLQRGLLLNFGCARMSDGVRRISLRSRCPRWREVRKNEQLQGARSTGTMNTRKRNRYIAAK